MRVRLFKTIPFFLLLVGGAKLVNKKIICLNGEKYLAYLKEVATRLGKNGIVEKTTMKAYIKKIGDKGC